MKYFGKLAAILIFICLAGCAPSDANPSRAQELLQQGAILVDVRTQSEYDSGHLEGSIHLPYERILELAKQAGVEKNTPVVLYCQSGRRSGIAKQSLEQAGYTNVHNGGGYQALSESLRK